VTIPFERLRETARRDVRRAEAATIHACEVGRVSKKMFPDNGETAVTLKRAADKSQSRILSEELRFAAYEARKARTFFTSSQTSRFFDGSRRR
jgi:hypothetical protein